MSIMENEMSHIRSVFDRAANAIVQASELSVQVQALSEEVKGLHSDIEYVRNRNRELDTILSDVRDQRDKAQTEVLAKVEALNQAESRVASLTISLDSRDRQIADLEAKLAQATKERDDYAYQSMDLTDKLSVSQAKLEKIEDFAKSLFPIGKSEAASVLATPVAPAWDNPPSTPPIQAISDPISVEPATNTFPADNTGTRW